MFQTISLVLFDSFFHVPSSPDSRQEKNLDDSLLVVNTLTDATELIQRDEALLEARLKAESVNLDFLDHSDLEEIVAGSSEYSDVGVRQSPILEDLPDFSDDEVVEVPSDSDDHFSETSLSEDEFVPRKKKTKIKDKNCPSRISAEEKLLVSFDLPETSHVKHYICWILQLINVFLFYLENSSGWVQVHGDSVQADRTK